MAKSKKTTQVKLTPEQLQELKDAIRSGESPKSIHDRLGASLANIHYHKGELKKKGLLDNAPVKKSAPGKSNAKSLTQKKKTPSVPAVVTTAKEPSKPKALKLIVNGISIHIESAGAVSVGEGFIKIDY